MVKTVQRITDEAGLLACATYVDLNAVRAAKLRVTRQAFGIHATTITQRCVAHACRAAYESIG